MQALPHPDTHDHSGRFAVARWALVRARWSNPAATQAEVATIAGTSQPAVSQALARLTRDLGGLDADRLAEYYLTAYPGPKGHLSYWASAEPIMTATRRLARLGVVVSGDAAADLIAPWRIPAALVAYAAEPLTESQFLEACFVPVDRPEDANLAVITQPVDSALLVQTTPVDGIVTAHPLHVAYDLLRLGAEDRAEAAERVPRLGARSSLSPPLKAQSA